MTAADNAPAIKLHFVDSGAEAVMLVLGMCCKSIWVGMGWVLVVVRMIVVVIIVRVDRLGLLAVWQRCVLGARGSGCAGVSRVWWQVRIGNLR